MAEEITNISFLFFIAILHYIVLITQSEKQRLEPKYSTKTGYDLAFNKTDLLRRELSWKELFLNTPHHDLQSCSPAGLYVVYRHGTRYPSSKDIKKFNALLNRVKENNLNPEHELLRNGKEMSVDLQRALSESGKFELKHLAARIKKRFPELFPDDFHVNDFSFQTSNLSRTIDSTLSFIQGLVDNEISQTFSSLQTENELTVSCQIPSRSKEQVIVPLYYKTSDYLLRFVDAYVDCLKEQNKSDEREDVKFIDDSEEMGAMQQRLIEKLSVPGSKDKFNLSRGEALNIATLCGYELALFNQSGWCNLLTDEDIKVFEYKQDLKHYWKRGYGHPVNYLVGCDLVRDVVDYFKQVTSKRKKTPKGVFKFAHAETLIPLESLLGLYKDKHHLTASTFKEHQNRKFRTSWMTPFAGNVAFILFNCTNKEDNAKTVYKLEVLINKLPVDLPFCQTDSSCKLEDFTKHIGKVTGGRCNFNNTCCIENCGSDDFVPFEFNQWTIFCIPVAGVALYVWIIIAMVEFGMSRERDYMLLKKPF